ncbi:MAG: VWA domain-containing protein [Acidobacteriota bacterium]
MLILILCLLVSPLLIAEDPSSFTVKADLVTVPVTVFDQQGRMISGLTRHQFVLLDENEPRPIENFLLDRTPLHVLLLLDVSASLREEVKEIQKTAYRFAQSFHPEDQLAVVSFSDGLTVLQPWTNDKNSLRRALKKLRRGYRTALYDALEWSVLDPLTQVSGKKVIILLTDGLDNQSLSRFDTVLELLLKSDISLYIVSRTRLVRPKIEESDRVGFVNQVMQNVLREEQNYVGTYFQEKEASLSHLAEITGGRIFFPERLEDLRESYMEVAQELQNQYLLTFRPPPVSQNVYRAIQVLCTETVGRINHRKRYHWRP